MKLSNRPIDIITTTLKGARTHSPDNSIDRECDYTISWHDYVPWTHRPQHTQHTRSEGYYTVVLFFCGFKFDVYLIVLLLLNAQLL